MTPERSGATGLRMGIDVGSTNTDTVLVDADGVVTARAKVPAVADLAECIDTAVSSLLVRGTVDPAAVCAISLGTDRTQDSVDAGADLRRVAVLRIGAPLSGAIPPMATWPAGLRSMVDAGTAIVAGGCELDGTRIAPLDERAVARFADAVAGRADAVAVTAVFSPVDPADELRAARILADRLGPVTVSASHEIGSMGLLERENATVLNAALSGGVEHTASALRAVVRRHGMDAECFLTQRDGTLRALGHATRFPILAIGSGPANSMRGGAHGSGLADAVVVDVGGSRTTVGRLVDGFPDESTSPYTIGGVVTNLRLPDLVVLPLGGGSLRDARCNGGPLATLTDAAVADGRTTAGGVGVPESDRAGLARRLARYDQLLAEAVDRIGLGAHGLPVLVVGGGGGIAPDRLPGIGRVVRPPHGEVANAVGAAVAPVGGTAERICGGRPDLLRRAVEELSAEAVDHAVQAGAWPERVRVAGVEEIPLSYLRDPAVRVRVRAVGPPLVPPRMPGPPSGRPGVPSRSPARSPR
ncbi:hydantoinase/oxoprolinase family protein [Pseudonocardia kongjuensis]|uniref:Hydantoinase/oxoprolinase family protein n=2 Tax=Pseudonocardia kongjuensis TaxID=102227 RepID=A0ABN1XQ03_9PSEU